MSVIGKIIGYAPKIFNYGTRLVKASPYIIFHDAAKGGVDAARTVTRAANQSWRSVFKDMLKNGMSGIEKSVAATKAAEGGFLKAAWKSISEIPSILRVSSKWGAARAFAAAKAAGKTPMAARLAGVLGGAKGFFKGIGKKMPLIGNILLVAFELPNIIDAVKEKGLIQGGKEVVKAGARLTAASIASAVGTAVAGPIGGIVGFIAGDWLASKVVGKSYSEQKAEKEQQAAEDMARLHELTQQQGMVAQTPVHHNGVTNPFQPLYPYGYNNPSLNPYSNDIMMQSMRFDMMA